MPQLSLLTYVAIFMGYMIFVGLCLESELRWNHRPKYRERERQQFLKEYYEDRLQAPKRKPEPLVWPISVDLGSLPCHNDDLVFLIYLLVQYGGGMEMPEELAVRFRDNYIIYREYDIRRKVHMIRVEERRPRKEYQPWNPRL
jgi:hypothetical protein